jgi:hypothetical protein
MKPDLFDITRRLLGCEMPPGNKNWTDDAPEWSAVVQPWINNTVLKIPPPRAPALQTIKCDYPGSEIYELTERLRLVKYEYGETIRASGQMLMFPLQTSS